ncbi:uncharacterized protein LOC102806019 [Saccoglossus kowalevskii]|uniref:Uncharacterized protein LOC102806019 n=1 Tax=Saccoglossus kowalevskii TaxID=10224 RepID=A0ABM0MQV4_SACKO|nr:PREDICTED: uncharacterized protein LOC102806019 [Saccoglossus kowalevskii]
MTSDMVSAGFAHNGSMRRLHNILNDVLSQNRSLKIGIIGGSISAGGGLGGEEFIYSSILEDLLCPVLNGRIEIHNAAIGAADSSYYRYCLKAHLNASDMDIIVWELALNDYLVNIGPDFQEDLTRQILELPQQPQLFYVNFVHRILFTTPRPCRVLEKAGSDPLSVHYEIPSVSLPNALCTLLRQGRKDVLLGNDNNHPGRMPHKIAAILLIHLIESGFQSILSSEQIYGIEKLPLPLFNESHTLFPQCWSSLKTKEGNYHPLTPLRYDKGWAVMEPITEGEESRIDSKTFWGCKSERETIVFPINIEPIINVTVFNVHVAMLGCIECGRARISVDAMKYTEINAYWEWNVPRIFHITANVGPGMHNVTITSVSNQLIRLIAVMAG